MASTYTLPRQTAAKPASRLRSRESTDALRASVLDAALQLGLTANPKVANWIFNFPVEEEEEEEEEVHDWGHPISPSLTSASTDESSSLPYTPPSTTSQLQPVYLNNWASVSTIDAPKLTIEQFDANVAPLNKSRANIDRELNANFPFLANPPEYQDPSRLTVKAKLRKKRSDILAKDSGYATEKDGYASEGAVGYDTDGSSYTSSSGKKHKVRRFFGLGGTKKSEAAIGGDEGSEQGKMTVKAAKKEKKAREKKAKEDKVQMDKEKKSKPWPVADRPPFARAFTLPVHIPNDEPLIPLPPIAERFATALPGASRPTTPTLRSRAPTPTQGRRTPLPKDSIPFPTLPNVPAAQPFLRRSVTPSPSSSIRSNTGRSRPSSPSPTRPPHVSQVVSPSPELPVSPLVIKKKASKPALRHSPAKETPDKNAEPERKASTTPTHASTPPSPPVSPPSVTLRSRIPTAIPARPRVSSHAGTPGIDGISSQRTPGKSRPSLTPIVTTSVSGNTPPMDGASPVPSSAFLVPSPGRMPVSQSPMRRASAAIPSWPSDSPASSSPAHRSPSTYLPSSKRPSNIRSATSPNANRFGFHNVPPSPPPVGPLPAPPVRSDAKKGNGSTRLAVSAPGSRSGSRGPSPSPSPSPLGRTTSQSQRGRESPFPARPVLPGLYTRASIRDKSRRTGVRMPPSRSLTADDTQTETKRRSKHVAFAMRVDVPSDVEDDAETDSQLLSYRPKADYRKPAYSPSIRWASRGPSSPIPVSPSLIDLHDDRRVGRNSPPSRIPTLRHTTSQPNLPSHRVSKVNPVDNTETSGVREMEEAPEQNKEAVDAEDEDDASMYPDDDRSVARSTMYFMDGIEELKSPPILDGPQSNAVRERFVRRVMRWQDSVNGCQ